MQKKGKQFMNHTIVKRILTVILTLVLLMQIIPATLSVPASAVGESDYTDVTLGTNGITQEHLDAINYVTDNGFMNGTGNNKFSPKGVLTRAEAITVLYRMSGEKVTAGKSKFTDLDADWYKEAVAWGVKSNVVA